MVPIQTFRAIYQKNSNKCLILQLHVDHTIKISLLIESCICYFTVTHKKIYSHVILLYVIYKCSMYVKYGRIFRTKMLCLGRLFLLASHAA